MSVIYCLIFIEALLDKFAGGIECIDCIESMIAPIKNPTYAFLTGQSLKYLARYTMKNGVEDLKKARWYLDRLIGKVEKE